MLCLVQLELNIARSRRCTQTNSKSIRGRDERCEQSPRGDRRLWTRSPRAGEISVLALTPVPYPPVHVFRSTLHILLLLTPFQ